MIADFYHPEALAEFRDLIQGKFVRPGGRRVKNSHLSKSKSLHRYLKKAANGDLQRFHQRVAPSRTVLARDGRHASLYGFNGPARPLMTVFTLRRPTRGGATKLLVLKVSWMTLGHSAVENRQLFDDIYSEAAERLFPGGWTYVG
jgi:hypothetical protein